MKPRVSLALATAALAAVTATSPVLATCVPAGQAFPPGLWMGQIANLATFHQDEFATATTDGVGSFWVRIGDGGEVVDGSFEFHAIGHSMSWAPDDDSASAARFQVDGKLSGTANAVQIDGEMSIDMEAIIDVHHGPGPDPYSGSGNDLYGVETTINSEYSGELMPHHPGCGTLFGEMEAPVGFDDGWDGTTVHFYAVRSGGPAREIPDVEEDLVALLEDADRILGMDPFDSDLFLQWVLDLLRFDAKVVALEACNPDDIKAIGPAWSLIRSVMLGSIDRFLTAADDGAYETVHVIQAMRAFLRGGLLGWRGQDCIDPQVDDRAEGLFVKFEEILIERLELAWDANDQLEIQRIALAAYQFGLPRLVAVVEGGAA